MYKDSLFSTSLLILIIFWMGTQGLYSILCSGEWNFAPTQLTPWPRLAKTSAACQWVGPSPSTNKLREVFLNGAWQHQYPCGKMSSPKLLLTGSVSPYWVPVSSCLSWKLSKIDRCVWPRLLSNYCFYLGSWSLWEFVCTLWE